MIVMMAVIAPVLVAQRNDGARPIGDLGWKLWAKVRDMAQSEWSISLENEEYQSPDVRRITMLKAKPNDTIYCAFWQSCYDETYYKIWSSCDSIRHIYSTQGDMPERGYDYLSNAEYLAMAIFNDGKIIVKDNYENTVHMYFAKVTIRNYHIIDITLKRLSDESEILDESEI